MKRSKTQPHDPMRCPRCRSRHVQSLSMAYSQAARDDLKASLSQFAKSIAPPTRLSVFLGPVVAGLGGALLVQSAVGHWSFEIKQALDLSSGDLWDAARPMILGVGILTAIAWHLGATSYNRHVWSKKRAAWESKAVCRRCACIFVPKVNLAESNEANL